MPTRKCPNCGTPVSHKADECFMCGYKFDQPRRLRVRIPWADVALVLVIVALVVLWWRWDDQQQVLALTPSATPTITPTATITPTVTPTPTATATPTVPPTPTPILHTVKSGDTYLGIATDYGISLEALLAANNLKVSDIIQPGQTLIIPPEAAVALQPTVESNPNEIAYPIAEGDTIDAIADRFGVESAIILENNDLSDPNQLQVGQVLIIPLVTPTPEVQGMPSATPAPTIEPPLVISPPDGAVFTGATPPLLRWVAESLLPEDVWYQVNLIYGDARLPKIDPILTKASSVRLDESLRPPADATSFEMRWWVRLVRVGRDGEAIPISPPSPLRRFEWR